MCEEGIPLILTIERISRMDAAEADFSQGFSDRCNRRSPFGSGSALSFLRIYSLNGSDWA